MLLKRGRDGFFIFVPKEVGMVSTYSALVGAVVREMRIKNSIEETIEGLNYS
jgi:hypothetical protein